MQEHKIYYRVEVRLKYKCIEEEDEENCFEYEELLSWSDGAVIIEDGTIRGYLTDDYIWGEITENQLVINIVNDSEQYFLFKVEETYGPIELPNRYNMQCMIKGLQIYECTIEFKEKEKNPKKTLVILNEVERVEESYGIIG